jgi:hypothetical protein
MMDKPAGGQLRDPLKRPGLFEKVSSAGNNLQLHFALHSGLGLLVQLDHDVILAADN